MRHSKKRAGRAPREAATPSPRRRRTILFLVASTLVLAGAIAVSSRFVGDDSPSPASDFDPLSTLPSLDDCDLAVTNWKSSGRGSLRVPPLEGSPISAPPDVATVVDMVAERPRLREVWGDVDPSELRFVRPEGRLAKLFEPAPDLAAAGIEVSPTSAMYLPDHDVFAIGDGFRRRPAEIRKMILFHEILHRQDTLRVAKDGVPREAVGRFDGEAGVDCRWTIELRGWIAGYALLGEAAPRGLTCPRGRADPECEEVSATLRDSSGRRRWEKRIERLRELFDRTS